MASKPKDEVIAVEEPPATTDSKSYTDYLDQMALQTCGAIGVVVKEEDKNLSPTFKVIRKALGDVHANAKLIEKKIKEHEAKHMERDALEVAERNKSAG